MKDFVRLDSICFVQGMKTVFGKSPNTSQKHPLDFFKKLLEDISPFCGVIDTLFWTSGDVCPRFQSQVEFRHLRGLLPMCSRFLRFISGATPADLLYFSS